MVNWVSDDQAQINVTEQQEGAGTIVSIDQPGSVAQDESWSTDINIQNNGDVEDTMRARVQDSAGVIVGTSSEKIVSVGSSSTFTVTGSGFGDFTALAQRLQGQEFVTDDQQSFSIGEAQGEMVITDIQAPSEVLLDESWNIDVTIENTGDVEDTGRIKWTGDLSGTSNTQTISPGGTVILTISGTGPVTLTIESQHAE